MQQGASVVSTGALILKVDADLTTAKKKGLSSFTLL